MTVKLKHIDRFKDRHGKLRLYYRQPSGKRIPLPNEDDPGFLTAYQAATSSVPDSPKAKTRGADGTVDRLASDYFKSTDFLGLRPSTQAKNRGLIDRFCEKHGHRLVRQMTRQHVSTIIGKKAATPAGANNLLKIITMLLNFAVANGYRTDNPAIGIKKFKQGTYHTWTEDEITQFEAKWAIGTPERLAFALHLFTGQRRSDVHAMTWATYNAGHNTIDVIQEKTGAPLTISVHKDLRKVLDATPRQHVVILHSNKGKARTVESHGNWMADAIAGAALPERCVLHGIRKAAARRLAEAGCSAHEIMSITGHKTLSEVERYCREAGQKALSKAAILRLEEHTPNK